MNLQKAAAGNSAAEELAKAYLDEGRIVVRKQFSKAFGKALLIAIFLNHQRERYFEMVIKRT